MPPPSLTSLKLCTSATGTVRSWALNPCSPKLKSLLRNPNHNPNPLLHPRRKHSGQQWRESHNRRRTLDFIVIIICWGFWWFASRRLDLVMQSLVCQIWTRKIRSRPDHGGRWHVWLVSRVFFFFCFISCWTFEILFDRFLYDRVFITLGRSVYLVLGKTVTDFTNTWKWRWGWWVCRQHWTVMS